MIDLAATTLHGWRLPVLADVHRQMLAATGVPWVAMEKVLGPRLGEVSLAEAIRFYEAVKPPARPVGMGKARIFGKESLTVVANTPAEARLTEEISIAARRIVTFSGAALVNDVRAMAEEGYGRTVPLRNVVRTLDVLPELEWLDDSRRWCWYNTAEMSPLLRRAAEILVMARAPVDMETLYAGLVRASRRAQSSANNVSDYTDPVPPSYVVHAILIRHPAFRRSVANIFTFTGTLEQSAEAGSEAETVQARILQVLESHGGAASTTELMALTRDPINPISAGTLGASLYIGACIERLGAAAWAIRGRPIDPARESELVSRVTVGAQWSVEVPLTDSVRLCRILRIPASAVPLEVDSVYRMSDGHEVRLLREATRQSYRLTQLGSDIKMLLADASVEALRFFFDNEQGTVDVHPERSRTA